MNGDQIKMKTLQRSQFNNQITCILTERVS